MDKKTSAYAGAGVDIDEMMTALSAVKSMVKRTSVKGVLSDIGSFGGLFQSPGKDEVLVASMAFVRWTIPLNAIVEAFAARGWAPAAPALSRDRLQINYVHKSGAIASLRVSPENGEDFVADLRRTVIRAKQEQGPIESSGSIHSSYMGPAPDEGKISF